MVRNLRLFYVSWMGLIAAAIVIQLYLAGYGVFAFKGLPPFDAHRALGDIIGIAVLIAAVAAFAARVPRRLWIGNLVLVALYVIQFLLATAGVQVVSALHIVNGVLIFVVVLYLVWQARVSLDLAGTKAPNA